MFRAIKCSSSGGLNFIVTAFGIVTLCKRPYSAPVENALHLSAPLYRDADKSLARPGRKQAIATEDFDVHISSLEL
jgi:hypothetical protein